MIIGLTGAANAGKTTLAQAFCDRNKHFRMGATSTSAVMAQHGMDPKLDYPMDKRLWIQNIILGELDKFYAQFSENAIFDRTPLDAAAYLLADVQRQNVELTQHPAIVEYVERAISITNRRFSMIVCVPPVLPERRKEEREGKAPSSPAYAEHFHQIINGLRCDERMKVKHFVLPRGYIDIDLRVRGLESATGRVLRNFLADNETNSLNGISSH